MWLPSRIAKGRSAKRRSKVAARIDQWPFVGASSTLLIMFMLIAGLMPHHGVYADLALTTTSVAQPKANREDAMRVTIMRDGSIYFRNVKIRPEELATHVRKAVAEGAERKVYLIVDAREKYGDAKVAYDLIAEGGVRDISLLVEKLAPH